MFLRRLIELEERSRTNQSQNEALVMGLAFGLEQNQWHLVRRV